MQIDKSNNELNQLQHVIYSSRNPMRKWLHSTRKKYIYEAILSIEKTELKSAVEIGPGSGLYIPPLCANFARVTVIDIEMAHLSAIEPLKYQFTNLETLEQDITLPYYDDKFDLVLCSEVIEHVQDTEKFVSSLSKLTATCGTLIISTPQPFSILELVSKIGLSPLFINVVRKIYKEPVLPTGHIGLIPEKKLITLLNKYGYVVNQTLKFGLYIPLIAEFGGIRGVKFAKLLEKYLLKIGCTWPLWTQLHICKKIS